MEMLRDPKITPTIKLITPIDFWYEKGHFWSTKQIWVRVIRVSMSSRNRPKILETAQYWVQDQVELTDIGVVFGYGGPCKCDSCKTGRKEVKKGWKPEIDGFGYRTDSILDRMP